MSNEFQAGDKVKYLSKKRSWVEGEIHSVRKVDISGHSQVLSYVIDTGKDAHIDEIITHEDEDNIIVRQPELIDVRPNEIKAL